MKTLGLRDPAFLAATAGGGGFDPSSVSGLELWLDASQEAYADLTVNPVFTDWSGNGRNYAVSTAVTYRTGITPKGTAVMRYPGGAGLSGHVSVVDLSTVLTTQAEMFVVLTSDSVTRGPWRVGNSGSAAFWTFAGSIYEDFFSTTRRNWVSAATITDFNVYNASSSATNWTGRVNGVAEKVDAVNAVGIQNPTYFGSARGGTGLAGDIAEVLIYSNVLSVADRADVEAYLQSKHIA